MVEVFRDLFTSKINLLYLIIFIYSGIQWCVSVNNNINTQMNVLRQSPSFNTSVASSYHDGNDDVESIKVKNYVREILKSRIFLGRYVERRLSNQRIGYRDIVIVSVAEVDLKKDLLEAEQKLRSVYPNKQWIGITDTDLIGGSSGGVCIWTEIDNQPFGTFWFQIKTLKFREDEIIVTLKCIRHITDAFLEIEPILTGGTKRIKEKSESNGETSIASINETYIDIVDNLKSALSIRNVKEFFTFLFAFIIAIFTGSTSFVSFLGNFILALVREISVLIKNSTPMFLGLLDFFSKIVGGFYILLAMFFKPNTTAPSNKRNIAYYDRSHQQNEYYDDRQFD